MKHSVNSQHEARYFVRERVLDRPLKLAMYCPPSFMI
jgi:hypothetical protein